MKKVLVGKIVNTFGIKGELKVSTNFQYSEKVFKKGNIIDINDDSYTITNVRYHQEHYLITINELNNINLVLEYKGQDIYINRDILNLKDDEYLLDELVNMNVYDNNELMGSVTEVINHQYNPLIKVNNEFYIPLKGEYIIKIDIKNKQITTQNTKELKL